MKIFVVCAPQTFGYNTGMFSVDLAAWYFFQENFPQADVSFYTLYPHRNDFPMAPYDYKGAEAFFNGLDEADVIIYWGDFLHSHAYRTAMISQLIQQGIAANADHAKAMVSKFLYLSDVNDALLNKVIVYGGTTLFNQPDDYLDNSYAEDIQRLFGGAKFIGLRDLFSASTVSYYRNDYTSSYHATDCAQLLDVDFFKNISESRKTSGNNTFGVFIGRSHLQPEKVNAFLGSIAGALDTQCTWLDWGRAPFFFPQNEHYKQYNKPASTQMEHKDVDPMDALSDLFRFDFIVSDTYHVCVNSWNLGIPAVCIIDDENPALSVNASAANRGRDKRMVFYWQNQLTSFLLSSTDLTNSDSIDSIINELSLTISDSARMDTLTRFLRKHEVAAKARLISIVQDLAVS